MLVCSIVQSEKIVLLVDNAKYTSPAIQNQMIQLVGSAILDEIVRRVKEAKLYSIIADETPDNSKTEQLSLLVRYVWNGKVEERLLAVIPVKETTAEVLFNTVCNKVEEHGIEISNLRGQCYDGASNVSGVHTGLQARIKELSPSALFTHCYAHVLNLVIVDTMNNNPIAKDFFGTLQNLYVFIETCSKRHAVYLEQQRKVNQASGEEEERKREYVLKKLSDTRWACRADSIKAFHHTIKAVMATLKDIRENEKKANIAAEAKGLLKNIKEFEFILALEVYFLYFIEHLFIAF